eukprot:gene1178-1330_t
MELPTEFYDLGVVEINNEFAKTFCPLDEGSQHVDAQEMTGEKVAKVAAESLELLSNTIMTTAIKSLKEQCDKLKLVAEDTSGKFKNYGGVNNGVISSVFDIMVDWFDNNRAKKEQWRVRDVAAICALRLAETESSSKLHSMIGETIIVQKISGCSAVRRVLNMDKANLELLNDLMNPSCVRSSKLSQNSTELQIKQLMEFMVRQDAERIRAEKERQLFCEHQTHVYTRIKSRIVHLEASRQLACKEGNELKKQQVLLACRIEHKALQEDCANLSDVGKQLNVAITFLSDIEEQLDGMDTKLDNIQADIQKIQKQMSLMIGRPVIDVIEDWTKEQLEKRLRDNQGKVYVDLQVREPDARGKSLWLPEDYEEEFMTQKVLRKLTVTPEVAEVVFEILPTVKRPAHSERQIKATLEKLLGKSKFNLVWGPVEMAINSKGLKTIQKGIEECFEKKMNEIRVLRDLFDRQLFWTVPVDAPDGIK